MPEFPTSAYRSNRNYTEIKEEGSSVESKCTSIDFVGQMVEATSTGSGTVEVAVKIPQLVTEPGTPENESAYIYKEVIRTIGGGLAAVGLLTGPGTASYYLRYRTKDNTTVSLTMTAV